MYNRAQVLLKRSCTKGKLFIKMTIFISLLFFRKKKTFVPVAFFMALSNLIALLLSATFKQTGLIVFLLSIDFLRYFPLAKEQLVRIGRYHSGKLPAQCENSYFVRKFQICTGRF